MRGVRINPRSVYAKMYCLHCHRRVRNGRAVLASTFYVNTTFPTEVHTQSQWFLLQRMALNGYVPDKPKFTEIEVRVVYHRACVEKILAKAPVDLEVEEAEFEQYRAGLLERFGVEEEGGDDELVRGEVRQP